MSENIVTYNISEIPASGVIQLGPIYDQDLDTVSVTTKLDKGSGYITFNSQTGDLTINQNGLNVIAANTNTTFTIIITLTDDNKISPGISNYVVNIFV